MRRVGFQLKKKKGGGGGRDRVCVLRKSEWQDYIFPLEGLILS